MEPKLYQHVLNELRGSVRLAIRGAANELTECHNISLCAADELVLKSAMLEIDELANLPTLTMSDVMIAIRASVRDLHADIVMENKESDKWAPRGTPTHLTKLPIPKLGKYHD